MAATEATEPEPTPAEAALVSAQFALGENHWPSAQAYALVALALDIHDVRADLRRIAVILDQLSRRRP